MDYNYSGYESMFGALFAFLGIVMVFALIIAILLIIARWKIFTKAGEEGWKAIIPVYSDMVLCKISGVWEWYPLVVFGASLVSGMLSGISESLGGIITLLASIASIYYTVILCISVAQSFGKDTGFGIGLLFLNVIFYPILAFGKSQYVGAKPMNDPIMGAIAGKQAAPATPTPTAGGNFCPQCGTSNPTGSDFCQKCGNKLN